MIGIYKVTSPLGYIYIGQSIDIENRFCDYKKLKCKAQLRIYNSFVKYGVENHIFETIEECPLNLLNEKERYWQDFYNVLGKQGLNCNLVSTYDSPKVLSKETKLKISNSLTGLRHTDESKAKISKGLMGRIVSQETRDKISQSNKNKKFSVERRQKISNALKGRKIPKEVIEKRNKKLSKGFHYKARIIVNTQNGVFYDCIGEAAECYNIKRSTLNNFLIGHRKNKTYLVYAS
jgi:group I intron endonuclease